MTIFASATVDISQIQKQADNFTSDSKITLNKSQLEGFITGDMDKATKMSFWDNIIDFFYPSYNKEEALELISQMIDFESEKESIQDWHRESQTDLLSRLQNNFEKLYELADEGTQQKFERVDDGTKTQFKIDGHTIASANAIFNPYNEELIFEYF
ncbi:hypothetical protein [uncultured Shewanella sp.]|uniref:hypothetical protein n=1 Tax=uncultured Shewanella sp. TaxID=173975 RepID=UPI002634681D|nr:hypothetical protein [uncultured Shewanella sp.]